jgi:hypothetical protein
VTPDQLVPNLLLAGIIEECRALPAKVAAGAARKEDGDEPLERSQPPLAAAAAAIAVDGAATAAPITAAMGDCQGEVEPVAASSTSPNQSTLPAAVAAATVTNGSADGGSVLMDLTGTYGGDDDDDSSPAAASRKGSEEGRVQCPICHCSIHANYINSHLDTCIGRSLQRRASPRGSVAPSPALAVPAASAQPFGAGAAGAGRHHRTSSSSSSGSGGHSSRGSGGSCGTEAATAPQASSAGSAPQRMPKMVYNIMKVEELRKAVKELNLPHRGKRENLEWRHREYCQLHNNACDGGRMPQPSDIVRMVTESESKRSDSRKRQRALEQPSWARPATAAATTTTPAAASAAASGTDVIPDSQRAHFEELIAEIEERENRPRTRVYTYVYQGGDTPEKAAEADSSSCDAGSGNVFHVRAVGGASSSDARAGSADELVVTELRLSAEGFLLCGGGGIDADLLRVPFVDSGDASGWAKWSADNDAFTLWHTSALAGHGGSRRFQCDAGTAAAIEQAVIPLIQVLARQTNPPQSPPPASPVDRLATPAADATTATNDAEACKDEVVVAAIDAQTASNGGPAGVTEADGDGISSGDEPTCSVCFCGEGELDSALSLAGTVPIEGGKAARSLPLTVRWRRLCVVAEGSPGQRVRAEGRCSRRVGRCVWMMQQVPTPASCYSPAVAIDMCTEHACGSGPRPGSSPAEWRRSSRARCARSR